MTLRIAHLSDIHFGGENAPAVAAAFDMLKAAPPDLVLISGDLTVAGLAGGMGRLEPPPVGRAAAGEVRVPVVLGPICGAAFIESAMRLRGKSTSVTVTVTFCATFTSSEGSLMKRSDNWLT